MSDENENENENVEELAGVPDGHVEINGETVVYEYDDEGNFIGWRKEAR